MELAIPLLALGSLYVVSNQTSQPKPETENFESMNQRLPNTDVPNVNYPNEYPVVNYETQQTNNLSTTHRYDAPYAYTDKYFNPTYTAAKAPPKPTEHDNILAAGGKQAAGGATPVDSKYYSLTGDSVGASYFHHNNMVPFSRKNNYSRLLDENSNESMLDAMTGSGSQQIRKSEQSPLFAPMENMHYAYGAPTNTEFVQSRMNVGMKMSNVKPFVEERVRPGLAGLDSEGYNSGMMARDTWMPKSADELRTLNKPKSSEHGLIGYEGPAMSKVVERGILGRLEKNKVDTMYENSPERYFTTVGAAKGHTMQPIILEHPVNRATTSTDYVGNASSTQQSTYVDSMYMPSNRNEVGELNMNPAVAVGHGGARADEYGVRAFNTYNNNRTTDSNGNGYFGAIGGAFGAAVAPLMDALKPTRKSNVVGNMRPYQNAKAPVMNSYIFNPADKLPTTIRETTQDSLEHHQVNANQNGGAYMTTGHQVSYTNRHTAGNYNYSGGAMATGAKQIRAYDADEYNQRMNDVKEKSMKGYMVKGNMSLLNGDINMRQKDMDITLTNNRAPSGAPLYPSTPDQAFMGKINGQNNGLYSNIQMDRTNPDILTSLKTNPYTLSVTNGL